MKLFSMDDYETWIGPDLETTKAAYLKEYGDTEFNREAIEDANEYTEQNLDAIKVDTSEDADGSGPIITARQLLADEIANGGTFPRMAFASEN